MTSHSDRFEDGETVWEAFAFLWNDGRPAHFIRQATFTRSATGYELLRYEDGRVDHHWPTPSRRAFRSRSEAVLHCISVLAGIRDRIEAAMNEILAVGDESGGPARAIDAAPAGTAQPEVAR